jgi:hypothetical protein
MTKSLFSSYENIGEARWSEAEKAGDASAPRPPMSTGGCRSASCNPACGCAVGAGGMRLPGEPMVINSILVLTGMTEIPHSSGQNEMQTASSRSDHSGSYRLEFTFHLFRYRGTGAVT